MLPRLATVVKDLGISAAGAFQGISQDGEVGEPAFIIDCLGELANLPIIPSLPGGVGWSGAERVTKDTSHKGEMSSPFRSTPRFVIQAIAVVDCLENPASSSTGTPVTAVGGKSGSGSGDPGYCPALNDF
jgi:hypothetical protein